jgi:hypothetical protein
MTLLVAQQIGAPSTPTYTLVTASDTVAADPAGLILHVKNTSGSSNTVTLTDPGFTPSGSVATNPSFAVPATTGDRMYKLPSSLQNSTGIITIANSAPAAGVVCAVFRA